MTFIESVLDLGLVWIPILGAFAYLIKQAITKELEK